MAINLTTFVKDLTYQADASVEQILKDLKGVDEEIKPFAEQKIAYFNTLGVWSLVGLLLIIILMMISFMIESIFLVLWTFILFGLLGFSLVFCSDKRIYYAQLKLSEERYKLVNKVMSMVNRDLAPNSKLKILIRFTRASEIGKKIKTLPHSYKRGWKVDTFENIWLRIQGEFIDSTNFLLTATEFNRKAYGQNANNKLKTKDKPMVTKIHLKLNFPSKKYGCMNFLREATQSAVKLPEGAKLKRLKVTPKAIDLTVQLYGNYGIKYLYKTITMMFLSLYQVLNFAKILSRKRQALPET